MSSALLLRPDSCWVCLLAKARRVAERKGVCTLRTRGARSGWSCSWLRGLVVCGRYAGSIAARSLGRLAVSARPLQHVDGRFFRGTTTHPQIDSHVIPLIEEFVRRNAALQLSRAHSVWLSSIHSGGERRRLGQACNGDA